MSLYIALSESWILEHGAEVPGDMNGTTHTTCTHEVMMKVVFSKGLLRR